MKDLAYRFSKKISDKTKNELYSVFLSCKDQSGDLDCGLETDSDPADLYLIVRDEQSMTLAYTSVYELSDSILIYAYVMPKYQKQGIFTHMLEKLKKRYPGISIDFYAKEKEPSIIHMLKSNAVHVKEKQLILSCPASVSHDMDCSDIKIQKEKNLELLSKIHEKIFEDYSLEASEIYVNEMAEMQEVTPYVFHTNGRPCGMCLLIRYSSSFYLCSFGILPEYRRKGLGFKCLEALTNLIRKEDVNAFINVQVDNDNLPAVKLYKSFGFSEADSMILYSFHE